MRKKITMCLLSAFLLITSSISIPVYAGTKEETKNIESMFQTAKDQYNKNLKEGKVKDNDIKYFTLKNQDGKQFKVKAFKYQEKNRKLDSNTDEIEETYVVSADKEYIQPLLENNNLPISRKLSGSDEDYDDSLGVKSYITLTYSKKTGTNDYLLTKVSGNWTIYDSSISISNRSVLMACVTPISTSQNITKYPSSNTFSYNTGFTKYATSTSSGNGLGCTTSAKLKRGSSTWTFTFNYSLFGNDYM